MTESTSFNFSVYFLGKDDDLPNVGTGLGPSTAIVARGVTVLSKKHNVYEGQWREGLMHGKGVYTFSTG